MALGRIRGGSARQENGRKQGGAAAQAMRSPTRTARLLIQVNMVFTR